MPLNQSRSFEQTLHLALQCESEIVKLGFTSRFVIREFLLLVNLMCNLDVNLIHTSTEYIFYLHISVILSCA